MTFASFYKTSFDHFTPLLAQAVAREGDRDEDHEDEDDWNDIDDDSRPDPWLDIDRDERLPSRSPSPPAKRRRPPSIDDFQGYKPQSGAHRRRALKRKAKMVEKGRVPRAPLARPHLQSAQPIPAQFDAATLPATHGAYTSCTEDKAEKRGSKKRR